MKLKFKSPYLSIDALDPVELPDFVVLTGLNESGHSHLMKAIKLGHVVVEGSDNLHIVEFEYESFRLANESNVNKQQLVSEREKAWKFYEQRIKPQVVKWRAQLGEAYEPIKNQCIADETALWNSGADALGARII